MGRVRFTWGDGAITDVTVGDAPNPWSVAPSHTYASPGTYTVTVAGVTNVVETIQVTVPDGGGGGDDPEAFGMGEFGTGTFGK